MCSFKKHKQKIVRKQRTSMSHTQIKRAVNRKFPEKADARGPTEKLWISYFEYVQRTEGNQAQGTNEMWEWCLIILKCIQCFLFFLSIMRQKLYIYKKTASQQIWVGKKRIN